MGSDPLQSKWFANLDERQQQEVRFALDYAQNYRHGTDGHNRLLLIALLANIAANLERESEDRAEMEGYWREKANKAING